MTAMRSVFSTLPRFEPGSPPPEDARLPAPVPAPLPECAEDAPAQDLGADAETAPAMALREAALAAREYEVEAALAEAEAAREAARTALQALNGRAAQLEAAHAGAVAEAARDLFRALLSQSGPLLFATETLLVLHQSIPEAASEVELRASPATAEALEALLADEPGLSGKITVKTADTAAPDGELHARWPSGGADFAFDRFADHLAALAPPALDTALRSPS